MSNQTDWEQLYWKLKEENESLKEKISHYANENQEEIKTNLFEQESEDWGGYIPGTPKAQERGCICPVLENQNTSDNIKWIDVDCPIHGKKLKTKWEFNNGPLKWNNDYKFVPAPLIEND